MPIELRAHVGHPYVAGRLVTRLRTPSLVSGEGLSSAQGCAERREIPDHYADRAHAGSVHQRAEIDVRPVSRGDLQRAPGRGAPVRWFRVGERREFLFVSSSPPGVVGYLAARKSSIRLFTAVTTLSLLDPVRAYEDYPTRDNLSGGGLELIIGKGSGAAQRQLFHVTEQDQSARNVESYDLFRQICRNHRVPAEPRSALRSTRRRYGPCPSNSRFGSGMVAPLAKNRST